MKTLLIVIFAVSLVSCSNLRNLMFKQEDQHQLVVAECPPDFDSSVEGNSRIVGYIPHFNHQNGTGISNIQTSVQICHRGFESLDITWNVADTQMISNYTSCNDPLYLQDAVMAFIGDPKTYMKQYLEVEVNPQGTLYSAQVSNPLNTCKGITNKMLQCNKSGLFYSASITEFGYKANAQVPIKLITGTDKAYHLKGNFFRVDYQNSGYVDYSAWKATKVDPACFHVPSSFSDILLV